MKHTTILTIVCQYHPLLLSYLFKKKYEALCYLLSAIAPAVFETVEGLMRHGEGRTFLIFSEFKAGESRCPGTQNDIVMMAYYE